MNISISKWQRSFQDEIERNMDSIMLEMGELNSTVWYITRSYLIVRASKIEKK